MRHIEESGILNLIGSMKRRHGGLIMIEVKNLEKSFGEQKVLNDVSLVCPNGEITGIIGHNGSGKQYCLNVYVDYYLKIAERF